MLPVGSCSPSSCSYVEDETTLDFALKTVALASPVFSAVMSVAAVVYGCADNHWGEREEEIRHEKKAREREKQQSQML